MPVCWEENIPEGVFSEDALISHVIYEKGYTTIYAPKAEVYVKYPNNIYDWILQKKRSAGGYNQLKLHVHDKERMRSFSREITGIFSVFTYPKNMKEFLWTIELIFLRLYLWILIYKEVNLQKKGIQDIWLRIESTK